MHYYKKEANHCLLGYMRIQGHQKALKENMKKHLSNDKFSLNVKELVIVRYHFPQLLIKNNGNKE